MIDVSTHSRLKAAGSPPTSVFLELLGFNTQPPEGGWVAEPRMSGLSRVSTHSRLKAAGRPPSNTAVWYAVSTHSRLKAAGDTLPIALPRLASFNTQPPEGGWICPCIPQSYQAVSTHSRLKAAGYLKDRESIRHLVSTHSRLKAAGIWVNRPSNSKIVSTHSRLKAAG